MDGETFALDSILNEASKLWVFGYGSILWKTGFHYENKKIGYITGYARRFWQGSTSHRGTPQNPGRVATLVPAESECTVWGAAYELVGKEMITEALDHLGVRECLLGGYITTMTPFKDREANSEPFPVLMFTATKDNSLFLGPASLDDLAKQVISCRGPCGHNIQYVTRLANFMQNFIPEETDEHLFGLVNHIHKHLDAQGLNLNDLVEDAQTQHRVPTTSVCTKCNALCSEYAFCASCRTDTIHDALNIAGVPLSTEGRTVAGVPLSTEGRTVDKSTKLTNNAINTDVVPAKERDNQRESVKQERRKRLSSVHSDALDHRTQIVVASQ